MTEGDLKLVAAGAAHAALLAALHGQCFPQGWTAASFAELVAAPGAITLVAVAGEEPVGLLLARVAAGEGEILTIGVLPALRRRGVAGRLLAACLPAAARLGCRMMFLEVGVGNEAAVALYAAAGFQEVGRRHDYYREQGGPAEDALVMRKDF